ncbi:hypothetical protein FJ661_07225 [Pseudarthrobacter phenanthrenivorans]|uniref:hypothetical protein n=1 Tax=Pseudarthrobacter phenanthrenivorans TaxID=361575 RepID=UPI0011290C5F|nr:hypothetical protein [Pseudarthrobacter phenanthrenivorans]TPV52183.1 hypothetical protein FJ661_07225 [Pseudarthrobacter phenanthrenivorans]
MATAISALSSQTLPADPVNQRPSIAIMLRGGFAFAVVFCAVTLLRQSDLLDGRVALLTAAVVITMAPTADSLSGRVFTNLVISMGFVPLTWWLPERIIGVDHATLALAAASASVAGWLFVGPSVRSRMRRVIPRIEGIDAIPILGAGLSAMSLWTMLRVSSAHDALTLFLTRWDYQSHFNIFEMIRTHGALIPVIPRGDSGESWGFAEYPQGFHAFVATLSELQRPGLTSLDSDLVSFLNLQALVAVMTVAMVLAGLCSINSIRSRAALSAPAIAVVAAVWIYGFGTIPLYEGFTNFYLACGMAAAAAIVLATLSRRIQAIQLAALAAAIMGVFSNWMILATFFAVPLVWVLQGLVRDSTSHRRRLRNLAVIVFWGNVAIVGSLIPVFQAGPVLTKSADVVKALGGILPPDFGLSVATILLVMLLGLVLGVKSPANGAFLCSRSTAGVIALGVTFPVAICLWLAVSQIRTNGEVAYYFYKFLVALVLYCWPVVVIAAGAILDTKRRAIGNRPQLRVRVLLCLFAASATQVFGFSGTGLRDVGLPPTATSVIFMEEQEKLLADTPGYVVRLLASAKVAQPADTVYISASDSIDPVLAARWQWGMRGAATQRTTDMSTYLDRLHKVPGQDPDIVHELLMANPGTTALVDVEIYATLSAYLDSRGLHGRVMPVG